MIARDEILLQAYPHYCTQCDGPCVEPEVFGDPEPYPWGEEGDATD